MEIAQRLLGARGNPDRGEFAGTLETSEVACVEAIGLDAPTGAARDQGWCAGHSERLEQPVGVVAVGSLVAGERM